MRCWQAQGPDNVKPKVIDYKLGRPESTIPKQSDDALLSSPFTIKINVDIELLLACQIQIPMHILRSTSIVQLPMIRSVAATLPLNNLPTAGFARARVTKCQPCADAGRVHQHACNASIMRKLLEEYQ